jgi:hypothetical protein
MTGVVSSTHGLKTNVINRINHSLYIGINIMNAQTKTMPQTTVQSISDKVDRFVDLSNQLAFVDSLVKERDSLRKMLAEHADSVGTGAVMLTGHNSYVSFSKPPLMRNISNVGAFLETVGIDSFLTAVKISTTAADKLLNETQKVELCDVSVGSRRVKDCGESVRSAAPRQGAQLFEFLAGMSIPAR